MGNADRMIADRLIEHGVNLLRFGAGMRAKVLAILQAMEIELTGRLVSDKLTDVNRSRAASLLKETSRIIGDYYAEITKVAEAKLNGVSIVEGKAIERAITSAFTVTIDVAMPTQNVLTALASDY